MSASADGVIGVPRASTAGGAAGPGVLGWACRPGSSPQQAGQQATVLRGLAGGQPPGAIQLASRDDELASGSVTAPAQQSQLRSGHTSAADKSVTPRGGLCQPRPAAARMVPAFRLIFGTTMDGYPVVPEAMPRGSAEGITCHSIGRCNACQAFCRVYSRVGKKDAVPGSGRCCS